MRFFSQKISQQIESPSLGVEQLEPRQMLSGVTILASGDMGGETFDVIVDDARIASFTTTTEYREFQVDYFSPVRPEQVRIEFTNDQYMPEQGVDRNLNIDFITIDGFKYEAESENTFASGVWDPDSNAVVEGFLQTNKLVTNGFFEFAVNDTGDGPITVIEIDARSSSGEGEEFNLQIRGETVAQYRIQDFFRIGFNDQDQFRFVAPGNITADDIRIVFTNDDVFEEVVSGLFRTVDRNLTIDSIKVNGETFRTNSDLVFSTGVWDVASGTAVAGLGRGDTLHTNGYFQYSSNLTETTTIHIDATGSQGNGEIIDLQIGGVSVAQFNLFDNPLTGQDVLQTQFSFIARGRVAADDIVIAFSNDSVFERNIKGFTTIVDRNLTIDSITVDDTTYFTDSPSVFATGVWSQELGTAISGYGIGSTLHTNGYFLFSTS